MNNPADAFAAILILVFGIALALTVLNSPAHAPHVTADSDLLTSTPPVCTISEPSPWAADTSRVLLVLLCDKDIARD